MWVTKIVGDTFDAVFAMLHGAQYPDRVREAIADRVLEFSQEYGRRDPQAGWHARGRELGIKLDRDAKIPLLLTKEIRTLRQAHAANCAREAKNAACPNIREDFLRLEQNWLQLARSYEIAQQIVITGE